MGKPSENHLLRGLVVAACVWEAGAIVLHGPTWTAGIHWARNKGPAGTLLIGTVWTALTYHFFLEDLQRDAIRRYRQGQDWRPRLARQVRGRGDHPQGAAGGAQPLLAAG